MKCSFFYLVPYGVALANTITLKTKHYLQQAVIKDLQLQKWWVLRTFVSQVILSHFHVAIKQMRWDKPHKLIFPVAEKVVVDKVLQRPVPYFLSSVLHWFTRYQRCWWPHHTVNLSEFMSFFGRSGVGLIGFSNTIFFVVIILGH